MKIIVMSVIIQDGKLLMIQEAKEKCRGKWWLPAGHLDEGETIKDAAIREAKEETGYDIQLTDLLSIISLSPDKNSPEFVTFYGKIISGGVIINPEEILDVKWIPLDEVGSSYQIRKPELLADILNDVANGKKYPLDIIKVVEEEK